MTEVPTFFFSHARKTSEQPGNYLRRFFDDLESTLSEWAPGARGTLDRRVPQGDNWDEFLTKGLTNDNVFVAILTPFYFGRPNCGKELGVFLLRSPELGIDPDGALTGAKNLMLIRWLPEKAYTLNTIKDSLIPQILRLIEDTPVDEGRDPARTRAIDRYRKKGMQSCIRPGTGYYTELLNLFVAAIRGMPKLSPAADKPSFATAFNAFEHDWRSHLGSAKAGTAHSRAAASLVAPQPLASVVAFYITNWPFIPDPNVANFADQLIAEIKPGAPKSPPSALDSLLADVRCAGVAEGLSVFHAAGSPVVPNDPEPLVARLEALNQSQIMTAIVIDPSIWPGQPPKTETPVVEQVMRSPRWTGPVLLPSTGKFDAENVVKTLDLPRLAVALPQSSEQRVAVLRRAFIDARGRILRTSTTAVPGAELPPAVTGPSAKGT